MKIKIIDCTIRDGGHLNTWHFNDYLVKASYFAASKASVDYFEIGYKNDKGRKGLGSYGYCDENFIFSLFKSFTNCKLLFMIDAGKYANFKIPDCDKRKTPFSGIRVAAYPYEINKAINIVEDLHAKGYEVFLQLMASPEWRKEQFSILEKWRNKNILNAVYFADSFGSYVPADIKAYVKRLKKLGFKSIGFHSHNNLQMAFANAVQAIAEGAGYIDASIYGMGRGAGNLPIEILISYLHKQGERKYNPVPYIDVIEQFYLPLYQEYGWGYSLKSLMGGIMNIHPYYVTELFKQKKYTIEEIWNILKTVKEECPISFSNNKLRDILQGRFYTPLSPVRAKTNLKKIENQMKIFPSEDVFRLDGLKIKNRHKDKKFLIIANGPSIKKYEREIKKLVSKDALITIGCNYLENLYEPDYHIFVSRKRFLRYISTVSKKSILIIPTFFGRRAVEENYNGKTEYINIISVKDIASPPINGIIQQAVYLNVATAAILTAYQMGAKEIMVAGMDGYEGGDKKKTVYFYNEDAVPDEKEVASLRYEDLAIELNRASDYLQKNGVNFSIITPTSHKRYYNNIFEVEKSLTKK